MRRFLGDVRGNVAIIFALALLPIAILVGGSVDLSRMRVERTKLQSATDAAVLAAAIMPAASTNAQIQVAIDNFLTANYDGEGTLTPAQVVRNGSAVQVQSRSNVPMIFAAMLGANTRPVTAQASAERGGVNVEVALVLDITGSMGGSKLTDLKAAANDLIATVVQDVQTPYYSKVAIVPYSNAVNVGANAAQLRGSVTPGKTLTNATWATGATKTITGATKARPVVVTTSNGHGFQNGDQVFIAGVKGMTQLNDRYYTVANRTNTMFELYDDDGNRVDGRYYSSFSSSSYGSAKKCANADCEVQITSNGHGFASGDRVHVTDVNAAGMVTLNDNTFTVNRKNANSFLLTGSVGGGTYSSGGKVWCVTAGCEFYEFTSAANTLQTHRINTCVSERTGTQAYTDAAASGAPLGRVYAPSGNPCPAVQVTPLTSNKTALGAQIALLDDGGSTAGQIGIAWGWYMLSPNFASLWPTANRPAAYATPQTLKVAVIMTDGAFNTGYCKGVSAKDTGYGSSSDRINCNATNGSAFTQAAQLCAAMKARGVVIYTVGFDISPNSDEASFMRACANDSAHAQIAATGTALRTAFRQIGDSIGQLRLTM